MAHVYDLREDRSRSAAVQRATLADQDFGFVPDPASFGSPEWWTAVESGSDVNRAAGAQWLLDCSRS